MIGMLAMIIELIKSRDLEVFGVGGWDWIGSLSQTKPFLSYSALVSDPKYTSPLWAEMELVLNWNKCLPTPAPLSPSYSSPNRVTDKAAAASNGAFRFIPIELLYRTFFAAIDRG